MEQSLTLVDLAVRRAAARAEAREVKSTIDLLCDDVETEIQIDTFIFYARLSLHALQGVNNRIKYDTIQAIIQQTYLEDPYAPRPEYIKTYNMNNVLTVDIDDFIEHPSMDQFDYEALNVNMFWYDGRAKGWRFKTRGTSQNGMIWINPKEKARQLIS